MQSRWFAPGGLSVAAMEDWQASKVSQVHASGEFSHGSIPTDPILDNLVGERRSSNLSLDEPNTPRTPLFSKQYTTFPSFSTASINQSPRSEGMGSSNPIEDSPRSSANDEHLSTEDDMTAPVDVQDHEDIPSISAEISAKQLPSSESSVQPHNPTLCVNFQFPPSLPDANGDRGLSLTQKIISFTNISIFRGKSLRGETCSARERSGVHKYRSATGAPNPGLRRAKPFPAF